MSMTVDALISLRSQTISGFVEGGITEETYRADLDALAVELDRQLTPAVEEHFSNAPRKWWPRSWPTAKLDSSPNHRPGLLASSSGVAATASA